jgi:hypothetical protein
MQALKDRLIREAIEDIEAELTVRAFERQQYLAALVNGFRPSTRALDLSLPARLLQAASRIGRGSLELAPPNGQTETENGLAEQEPKDGPKELPPPEAEDAVTRPAATESDAAEGLGNREAGASADAVGLVAKIRELRAQEPPAAWAAIGSELGLSDYALRKVRKENGLED